MLKNLIKMSLNLEPATPCGWIALPTQNASQKRQIHALKTSQGLLGGLNLAAENLENLEVQLFPRVVNTKP